MFGMLPEDFRGAMESFILRVPIQNVRISVQMFTGTSQDPLREAKIRVHAGISFGFSYLSLYRLL